MPAAWLSGGCAALTVSAALALQSTSSQGLGARGPKAPGYYWPHARGNVGRYSLSEYTAPANLTKALSWSWHHPEGQYATIVTSAPLIDDEKNLYIAGEDGVRKFSTDGRLLWYYPPRGPIATCPSLMSGSLFGNTMNGWVFALDMKTGKEVWAQKKAENAPSDTGYVEAHEGVVVVGTDSGPGGGCMRVHGLDAQSGRTLWEYHPGVQLWNIMPLFPGDDTWVAMDIGGGVHKHALHNESLIWHAAPPARSVKTFSDGGVMIGPDGTSYTCSNFEGAGQQGEHGALRAYAAKDGSLLWDRFLDYPCNSWPVISADGSSVAVPTGSFVASPAAGNRDLRKKLRATPEMVHNLSLALGNKELKVYGLAEKTAAIRAFDVRTGAPQWSVELPPYGRLAARGDEEGYLVRQARHRRDQCLPAQFGAPTLSGDGKLYVGRADGLLYAVDGRAGSYQTFDALAGFLHPGTSWAPGLMAVTTCDGLFVWQY